MNRRGFLGFLGAAIAGATLDPERLLWEPGKKFISIPSRAIPAFPMSVRYLQAWDCLRGEVVSRLDVLYGIAGQDFKGLVDVGDYGVRCVVVNGTDFDSCIGSIRHRMDVPEIPEEHARQFRIPSPQWRMLSWNPMEPLGA